MDQYLARKRKILFIMKKCQKLNLNAHMYEDMSKCICLYNAPDEEAVRRARKAVDTPIDGIENFNKTTS